MKKSKNNFKWALESNMVTFAKEASEFVFTGTFDQAVNFFGVVPESPEDIEDKLMMYVFNRQTFGATKLSQEIKSELINDVMKTYDYWVPQSQRAEMADEIISRSHSLFHDQEVIENRRKK